MSTIDPGIVVMHRSGDIAIIDRRKEDDSGWWCKNGGGLADRVIADGDWLVLTPEHITFLFAAEAWRRASSSPTEEPT